MQNAPGCRQAGSLRNITLSPLAAFKLKGPLQNKKRKVITFLFINILL